MMMKNKKSIKVMHLRSSGGLYGAEMVILNATRELDQMGCKNHIVCINNLNNPHSELIDEAARFGIEASSADSISLLDIECVKEIRQKLIDGTFDILHCHDYKASIYGLLASWGLQIKRVVTNHLWDKIDFKLWLYQRIEGLSYNWFDRIIAVSEQVKQDVRPYIVHKSKIEVITNGIAVEHFDGAKSEERRAKKRKEFGLKEDDIVIGIVGRLAKQKGHEYLFRAFARLKKNIEDRKEKIEGLKVLVVGDGSLEQSLKVLCEELGLPVFDFQDVKGQMSSIGYPPYSILFSGIQTDMPAVYKVIDILAMPSLEEGLPITLLEAMASGVPVIATPVGQIPEIIKDGETGFLVQPEDVEGLTEILVKIIEYRGEKIERSKETGQSGLFSMIYPLLSLQKITDNAEELVREKYSARAMAEKYLETYEWLVE